MKKHLGEATQEKKRKNLVENSNFKKGWAKPNLECFQMLCLL